MADSLRIYEPGQPFTLTTSAAVTGGLDVEVSGNLTVAHPGSGGSVKVIGSAAHDAASGKDVVILPRASGGVKRCRVAADVTAGNLLKSATGGQVTPWVSGTDAAQLIVGLALNGALSASSQSVTYLVL